MAPPTTTSSSSSSSSWSKKLKTKLSNLTETSSKESQQTLAKWIAFNRKHATAFVETLMESLKNASTNRQTLILSVISEILLLEQDHPNKWDRLADLRLQLGEALLEIADQIKALNTAAFIQEWDKNNVFGGPTLIHQIRRKITKEEGGRGGDSASSSKPKEQAPTTTSETKREARPVVKEQAPSASSTKKEEWKNLPPVEIKSSKVPSTTPTPTSATFEQKASPTTSITATATTNNKEVTYDFESKGIPAKTVDPKEFLEPCRAIATLQIARDLRNDAAVQLSSMLQSLPEDIRATVANAAETGCLPKLDETTLRDYSMRTPEQLIDMDLQNELVNVKTFRDVVTKQHAARQQLIELLVQSRCEFGANEAAEAFMQANRSKTALLQRAQILQDAMELEGLDEIGERGTTAAAATEQEKQEEEELPPLTWYQPDAKRQKVE